MLRQPMPRSEDQPLLFARGNTGRRTAKVSAGATAHLHENGRGAVAADEVDLAALDAEIACEHRQALRDEMSRGHFFTGIADLFRAE